MEFTFQIGQKKKLEHMTQFNKFHQIEAENRNEMTKTLKTNTTNLYLYTFGIEHLNRLFNKSQAIYFILNDNKHQNKMRNNSIIKHLIFTIEEKKNFVIKYDQNKNVSVKQIKKCYQDCLSYQKSFYQQIQSLFLEYFPEENDIERFLNKSLTHNSIINLFFNKMEQYEEVLQKVWNEVNLNQDQFENDDFLKHQLIIEMLQGQIKLIQDKSFDKFNLNLRRIFTNWKNFFKDTSGILKEYGKQITRDKLFNPTYAYYQKHFEEQRIFHLTRWKKYQYEQQMMNNTFFIIYIQNHQ